MATAIIQGDSPICHQCGKQFPKRRRGFSKFCSSTCKTLSHRDRRIAKRKDAGRRVIGDPALCATCGCAIVYTGGHGRYCDGCRQLARKGTFARWRENHPEKQRAIQRACDDRKLVCPVARQQRRERARKAWAARRKNPKHALDHRMSQLVRYALRGGKNGRKWEALVGYSLLDLAVHIERQFVRGMGWHNISKWQIDHIVPWSSFDYSSPDDADFKACWALSNLRPLWAEENLKKSDQRLFLI